MIERVKNKVRDVKQTVRSYGIVGTARVKVHEIGEKIRDIVVGPTFGELEREVKPEVVESVSVEKGFGKLKGGV